MHIMLGLVKLNHLILLLKSCYQELDSKWFVWTWLA